MALFEQNDIKKRKDMSDMSDFQERYGYTVEAFEEFCDELWSEGYDYCINDACEDLNFEKIKEFVKKGVNLNPNSWLEQTPLVILCRQSTKHKNNEIFEMVKLLIDSGADVNIGSPLRVACLPEKNNDFFSTQTINIDIVKLLIRHGADVNQKDSFGFSILMQCAFSNNSKLVKILLENGADINAKSEMTAFDLSSSDEIKNLIKSTKNNNPQKLVKLLSNFTIDKPIKYTTHAWDFGELKKEYGDFDGYIEAVKKQFESMKSELEKLAPNLYEKINSFLLETNPNEEYSWCSKTHINIGWSSLNGLQEWCNEGKNPFEFVLEKPITYKDGIRTITIKTFEGIINLFKQEIEVRENFKNLSSLFISKQKKLDKIFVLDLSTAKLGRQFYTDVEKFSNALDKIFSEINARKEYPNIEVITTELEDRSIEIKITQLDSMSSRSAAELLERANTAGDIAEIKNSLINLCDWSIESNLDDSSFRVNFLHSNNVKEIEILDTKPKGFTHILRFYK